MDTRATGASPPPAADAAERYLRLLKRCLTRDLFLDEEVVDVWLWRDVPGLADSSVVWPALRERGWRLVQPNPDLDARREGRGYPADADTMVGLPRLDNVQELITRVLVRGIPGDLVETGIWRGGTIALMRAVLAAYGDTERLVWACDSFQGLPEPDLERFPLDEAFELAPGTADGLLKEFLAVPVEQVRRNIARYDLLDDRIRFVEGWFRDTLPTAPIGQIAVLRLDGDLYESTRDALVHLEPKVAAGGFVIVDDYHSIDACRTAVDEYRAEHGIDDAIHDIDWTGVWWEKREQRRGGG